MYVVLVEFEVDPLSVEDFKKKVSIQAHKSVTLEDGCIQFDVSVNEESDRYMILYEVYSSREAFNLHLKAPHFLEFDAYAFGVTTKKSVTTWKSII